MKTEITQVQLTPAQQALAGGRASLQEFVIKIPQGVIVQLERIGAVTKSMTFESGIQAFEYEFVPAAVAYIERFVVK